MKAKDIMTSTVRSVAPDMSLVELYRWFLAEKLSGAPVVKDGRLVGVISRSDVIRHMAAERAVVEAAADYLHDAGTWEFRVSQAEADWIDEVTSDTLDDDTVADAMVHDVVTVGPDDDVADVARRMLQRRIHRVLVTEGSELLGVVTASDYVRMVAEGRH
jgi:CBS domain-containing protein